MRELLVAIYLFGPMYCLMANVANENYKEFKQNVYMLGVGLFLLISNKLAGFL